jgi:hypothetical protein
MLTTLVLCWRASLMLPLVMKVLSKKPLMPNLFLLPLMPPNNPSNYTPTEFTMNQTAPLHNSTMESWLLVMALMHLVLNIGSLKTRGELDGECKDTSG